MNAADLTDSSASTPRYEHRDLVIPLEATSLLPGLDVQAQYVGRATAALADALRSGWHAEDPTDWASMRRSGRLNGHMGHGFLGIGDPRYIYDSVTIRLTRRLPADKAN